jgi:hypothetical protein
VVVPRSVHLVWRRPPLRSAVSSLLSQCGGSGQRVVEDTLIDVLAAGPRLVSVVHVDSGLVGGPSFRLVLSLGLSLNAEGLCFIMKTEKKNKQKIYFLIQID